MSRLSTVRTALGFVTLAMFVAGGLGNQSALRSVNATGQAFKIGIVDFYGLNKVLPDEARRALTFKEGDTIMMTDELPPVFLASQQHLAQLPGVIGTRIERVCCDAGAVIIFVGIQEQDAPALKFRAAPVGPEHLPADIVQAGDEFSRAMTLAIQRGDAAEDRSRGHSLMHDSATRAIQERFIGFAKRDLSLLRLVLRNSSDAGERALAAQVLGYAADKQSVVDDLVWGMRDPSEEVRNNAMRALMVFAEAVPGPSGPAPNVPARPFIEFLSSLVWSDRNKASLALAALSARRDQGLLAEVRHTALTPLVEIARWKSAGHALPGFITLARAAGYSDEVASKLWDRGDREVVIQAAIAKR